MIINKAFIKLTNKLVAINNRIETKISDIYSRVDIYPEKSSRICFRHYTLM